MRPQIVLDVECYPNYFLALFYNPVTGGSFAFERIDELGINQFEPRKLHLIFEKSELVTFNGYGYDIPMLSGAIAGYTNGQLKYLTDTIIKEEVKPWQLERKVNLTLLKYPVIQHVDIMEVAPGDGGLKAYAGRLHTPKMQDLPYDPSEPLTVEQMREVKEYCFNDVRNTALLLKALTPQLELRRQMGELYGLDLMSKSDAQIAEAVIGQHIKGRIGQIPKRGSSARTSFNYTAPEFIKFQHPALQQALEIVTTDPFVLDAGGKPMMSKRLTDLVIEVGNSRYNMGMGGLHSMESSVHHEAGESVLLADWDVTSYYPSIILNNKLYPEHLTTAFLDVYKTIVEERIEAKKAGDAVKANSLKITINGSFGKFGSKYSSLYSPNLMIQTTVTGQLSLLMLIEWMERVEEISVVSANTDGIVVKCPKRLENVMLYIIKVWEERTQFQMERSDYSALYSRDVNNYIAVKDNGKVKTKGIFSSAGLQKAPTTEICSEAVIAFLTRGIPLEETVRTSRDITKFVRVQSVTGGAIVPLETTFVSGWVWDGEVWRRDRRDDLGLDLGKIEVKDKRKTKKEPPPVEVITRWDYLGKVIRWYYAEGCGSSRIVYKKSGNLVPRSEGSKPMMNLPDEFPSDIKYEWYINECREMLKSVGL